MERKSLARVELKDADQGIVSAVFSTFDVIDLDGDVVRKSAFKDGTSVRISAYNHGSWEGSLPVGKGVVRVSDSHAVCDMQFFMNTQHGRDTFEVVKEMGDLQEWSWGFHVTDYEDGQMEGKSVRIIKSVDMHEVSPVMIGAAGPGRTRTLAVKNKSPEDSTDGNAMDESTKGRRTAVRGPIPYTKSETVTRFWDGANTVKSLPEDARPSELRSVFAWVDPDADPEAKSSYAFAHHHGIGGQANIRACLQAIAKLNSNDPGIPEEHREAVYKHLSAHLLDADREPPKLRTAGDEKGRKRFTDEAVEVMAAVSSLIDRASEVVALRSKKNREMAPATADLLSWLEGDLMRLKSLLETPVEEDGPAQPTDEEVAAVIMAGLARINEL
jgi:HK97 family phage prohead protease